VIYGNSASITSPIGLSLDTNYVVDFRLMISDGVTTVLGRIDGAPFGTFTDDCTAATELRVGVMSYNVQPVHLNIDNVLMGTTAFGSSDVFLADFASAIVPPFDSTTGTGLTIVSQTLDASNTGADAYASFAFSFP
jgi:hypothetical protein